MLSRKRAFIELWIAGAFWGFGFVATRWALISFPPFTLVSIRFLLVGLVGALLALLHPGMRRVLDRSSLWHCLAPGFWLATFLAFQTIGLTQTTVARAGFLSALYVVWIPFFERKAISKLHWVCVAIALIGTALMCEVDLHTSIGIGDFFVLLCSLGATVHIFVIEKKLAHVSSTFAMNFFQSLWAGLFALPVAMIFEHQLQRQWTTLGWAGILILSLGSTMIAFAIQVRAQRVLKASTVSLFFLLESPFAAFFGWLVFSEKMSQTQWAGGIAILIAAILSLRTVSLEPAGS